MPILSNPRHEAFAQSVAQGMTADAAYAGAGYRRDRGHAARLAANGNIQARVAEVLAERARKAEFKLSRAIELMQEIAENRGAKESDRIAACRAVGGWCGWEKGTQAEQTMANSLIARLSEIRKRSRG